MIDPHFAYFIEKFGEAIYRSPVPHASISRWVNRLPPILLDYWREEGWAGYASGRVWTVNPDGYEDIKDAWLEGTPFCTFDSFNVIARSAFGDLFLCGEKTGRSLTVSCLHNEILALKNKLKSRLLHDQSPSIQSFFGSRKPEGFDCADSSGRLLFDRAVKTYGPLAPDEMYGFEPALVVGGKAEIENLRRLKIDPHLHILRQYAPPTLPFPDAVIARLMS
ncbi:GAD-like domain protein [Pseudomonas alkylphenolica]|uniref:GAD-like domain protein n=1 Tax=Pseudomonas alkylphenolica TaxID=237609 RepID=A0A443ZEI1_9PSED|nr:GAD-like domain-containing protein [Pseudomonas alkylphenolica]RWU17033.1 GAD-like domain protein [Pseudomonas alkylphenolica]